MEPYPDNIYPIEFTSAKATCVAFDPTGIKTPEKIIFLRFSRFLDSVELKPNENLFLENRTEEFRVSGGYTRFFNLTLFIQFTGREGYHRFSPSRVSTHSRIYLTESRS